MSDLTDVKALQDAIEDLWDYIDADGIRALRVETQELAKQIHNERWHQKNACPTCGKQMIGRPRMCPQHGPA